MTGRMRNTDSGDRVASRTGVVHAVGTRRRFGRPITVCGREVDHQYGGRPPLADVTCGQCGAILTDYGEATR